MAHNFRLHCVTTFAKIVEKGPILERALFSKGLVNFFNSNKENSFEDKPHYWNKNKNTVNDCVTDTKHIQVANASQKTQYPPLQQSNPHAILVPQGVPRHTHQIQ